MLKCKHPNSRKTKALAKKTKRYRNITHSLLNPYNTHPLLNPYYTCRINNRDKIKLGHAAKANILGEKFGWFTEQLEEKEEALTPEEFLELCDRYLNRFEEEIEQIKLKQSISKNRSHQHFSRESAINMTMQRENADFNGPGFQLLDLCNPVQFQVFKDWNGNTMSLQHIKMDLISKKFIENKMQME